MSNTRLIYFLKNSDERGELTSFDDSILPFKIKRIFYISDVPEGVIRGGHAHKKCEQIIIPITGKFEVSVENNREIEIFNLNSLGCGLYIPANH